MGGTLWACVSFWGDCGDALRRISVRIEIKYIKLEARAMKRNVRENRRTLHEVNDGNFH